MSIESNFQNVKSKLPTHVTLAAVSKTHPIEPIHELYSLGQRVFAENKVQELVEKEALLPKDIQWHLIGHLQRNKVKFIVPFVDTIQSVDSEKVLREINKQAEKIDRKIKVLLQVKIAQEDTKYGLEVNETKELLMKWKAGEFPFVEIEGLMGMASFVEDQNQVKQEFQFLKHLYDKLSLYYPFKTLSMGMSGDYPLAIECGATLVRVGSALFGARDYSL